MCYWNVIYTLGEAEYLVGINWQFWPCTLMHFFIPWFLELFFFYFKSSIWWILHSYYSLFSLCENVHTWNVSRIPTLQKYFNSCNRTFCCVSTEVSPLLRKGNSLALHIKGLVSFSLQWHSAVVYFFFLSPLLNNSYFFINSLMSAV